MREPRTVVPQVEYDDGADEAVSLTSGTQAVVVWKAPPAGASAQLPAPSLRPAATASLQAVPGSAGQGLGGRVRRIPAGKLSAAAGKSEKVGLGGKESGASKKHDRSPQTLNADPGP